jgi:hypothetical protein
MKHARRKCRRLSWLVPHSRAGVLSILLTVAGCDTPDAFNEHLHTDYSVLQLRACPVDQPSGDGLLKIVEVVFSAPAVSVEVVGGELWSGGAWVTALCQPRATPEGRAGDISVLVRPAAGATPVVHVTSWLSVCPDGALLGATPDRARVRDEKWLSLTSELADQCVESSRPADSGVQPSPTITASDATIPDAAPARDADTPDATPDAAPSGVPTQAPDVGVDSGPLSDSGTQDGAIDAN